MAIKKTELYSSLWASCDALRGGMDATQYKDYVLTLLFIKYISDKYAGVPYAPIKIPEGASFADMIALKGKDDIGDQINKKVIAPLVRENQPLNQSDFPDFADPVKLGEGKEMVDRLTELVSIFEGLNFSKNRADNDDLLGDAYEYLMRHFATESGKSKGQFYTPSEVSRIMAKIIGIKDAETSNETTVYDPTCGSGSLLLKVAEEAPTKVTLYGQEKDSATSGLARMNMILHDNPTASIKQGNTLSNPSFRDGSALKTFDFVVANPPFSDKRWSTGLHPEEIGESSDGTGIAADLENFHRFTNYGVPPAKQGDYAYLLHIVKSLKSKGKGACILPHGVLFRGNAEAEIRKNLIKKGFIKAIVGLPNNLFYGTGIPACIIVIDKENAVERESIFMIDASSDFEKDGNKNRLRAMDLHKIVDAFTKEQDIPKYAKNVSIESIEANDYSLNISRYIDSSEEEDIQDISAHLQGGIPERDIEALDEYWKVYPTLKSILFSPNRPDYLNLNVDKDEVRTTIQENQEFQAFISDMQIHFDIWQKRNTPILKGLEKNCKPKEVMHTLSEDLLAHYTNKPLVSKYSIYQHLMTYNDQTMQDDLYQIAIDGWVAEPQRIIVKTKDKGWECDLIPKEFIVRRYFQAEQDVLNELQEQLEATLIQLNELVEEHNTEDGLFSEIDKINKTTMTTRRRELKELSKVGEDNTEELDAIARWFELYDEQAQLSKRKNTLDKELDLKAYNQ